MAIEEGYQEHGDLFREGTAKTDEGSISKSQAARRSRMDDERMDYEVEKVIPRGK